MSVRKKLAGVFAGALATTAVLAASPAEAVVINGPYDSDFTPTEADLIAVGSDTTQGAVFLLSEAWNAQTPAPAFKVATYGAAVQDNQALEGCEAPVQGSTCQITLPGAGTVARPNGSGAGKSRLYGASNVPQVDFARSSAALNDAETQAGLQLLPFARDVIVIAVSNNVQSNAPATITGQQFVDIYQGEITNWNQIGGQNGAIVPLKPQTDSGTYSFFNSQMTALNGGTPITYGPNVVTAQEHDDTLLKDNPNAVAPFSLGRAGLLGGTLKIVPGWEAARAVYNVVRQADLTRPDIRALLGPDGFVCSDEATDLIVEAGFDQLAREDDGGVCGVATQAPTSNFTLNEPVEPVATTTTVAATSPGAKKATLKATVASSPTAEGTVDFFEGETKVGSAPLVGGVATLNLSGVAPGSHSYTAEFVPAEGTAFVASSDDTPATVTVKTTATITESFPSSVKKGAKAKGTVTVTLKGVSAKATGKVTIKKGAKTVGTGTLKSGKVTITLKGLAKGKNSLVITWPGDKSGVKAKKSFTITQK